MEHAGLAVAVAIPACCGVGATIKAAANGALLAAGVPGALFGLGAMAAFLAARRLLRAEPLQSPPPGRPA